MSDCYGIVRDLEDRRFWVGDIFNGRVREVEFYRRGVIFTNEYYRYCYFDSTARDDGVAAQ